MYYNCCAFEDASELQWWSVTSYQGCHIDLIPTTAVCHFDSLFWQLTAFFDDWRPFLMSTARTRRSWQPSQPFLTADGVFWCLGHVLDVHGSLHGLFWRLTAFFDNIRPFLMSVARIRHPRQPSRPFLTAYSLFWRPTVFFDKPTAFFVVCGMY